MKTQEELVLQIAFILHNQRLPTHMMAKCEGFYSQMLIFPNMCTCLEDATQMLIKRIEMESREFNRLFLPREI